MAITWGELESEVRDQLEDTVEAKYKWSQAELFVYLRDGLRDLSLRYPKLTTQEISVLLDTPTYSLPATTQVVDVVRAIYSTGREETLSEITLRPGTQLYKERRGYVVQDGEITLFPTPTEAYTLKLDVRADYSPPSAADATGEDCGAPAEGLLAIKYFIRSLAHQKEEIERARLAQWENSTRNSLAPVAAMMMGLYLDQVAFLDATRHSHFA